ncbi:DUF397 domain-containing protein [Streptomyces canus]|uniref:DUF397 domain-containing protein n=1 Tax=Streptomyces canus TaxID=58343 RepID=UPI0036B26C9F
MQHFHWQKSTYSGDGSNCVEIATTLTAIHVRDSKNTQGPRLAFPTAVWVRFISHMSSPASPMQVHS